MTGSWKVRGNQYIQFVRVLYCKLPTNGKQLPAFPLETVPGSGTSPTPASEVGGESVTTLPPWPPRIGLRELSQNPRIVIKKDNKRSSVLLMNTTDYISEG